MILFERKYKPDEEIIKNIFFNFTLILNGFLCQMNKSLHAVIILFLLLSSCGPLNQKKRINNNLFKEVREVIAGIDTTSVLAALRDQEIPPASNPNSITGDTLTLSGKLYYTVLAEYPNPIYNRFAITDSNYNILLLDKSLNGYLTESIIETDHTNFFKVEENFISKGVLGLRRISLYSIDANGKAELVFRTFTELREPDMTYRQDVVKIEPKEINTIIYSISPKNSDTRRDQDVFLFDAKSGKYTSTLDIFNDFVLSEVNNFNSPMDEPQIISRETYLKQMGITLSEKRSPHKLGKFSMPLSDEWNEVKNVKISALLKQPKAGTKFINNHYGSEISVIQIPSVDSAESYISYPLENISAGNYKVRFSEKISSGKYFYQFFEYSCGTEKFLLILQTLKTTYDLYKDDYQNLINSFSMDC